MVISLVLLFIICLILTFFEEQLKDRDKIFLYIIIGIAMILIAGLREVGSTPDTEDYEHMYNGNVNEILEQAVEPSFTYISSFLNSFSLSVTFLFLTYAIISITIHLTAFWKISKLPFLTLTIYISYYYMMHDMVQIRAAVASGLFIWAIYCYVEKKKLLTLVFILTGTLFHYSAILGLTIFLMNDNIPKWQEYILYALVPLGLVAYFTGLDLSSFVPENIGGEKLKLYRELKEYGMDDEQAGWPLKHNFLIWMNIILYYACIYYHEFLTKQCKYVPIAIKVQAFAFCCLFFLQGVSKVLSNRLNDYFSVASIILWTVSVYAFSPKIISRIINNVISTIRFVASMLAYALSLLWI